MSIEEAAKISGYAPFTLRMFCRQGQFVASKPMGNRHGWDINEHSFAKWRAEMRVQRGNAEYRGFGLIKSPKQQMIALLEEQNEILLRIETALSLRPPP